MLVSIHQPAYLPWLGYFDKIRKADVFVYLDTVQFQKNSFQNRNKIRTAQGSVWLTVSVETKGPLAALRLDDLRVNNRVNWMRKHRAAIEMNYHKAIEFERVFPMITRFYTTPVERLADYCFEMLGLFVEMLELDTRILRSSELPGVNGAKSDLILNICHQLGADSYLSGSLGRNYLELDKFEQAGVAVRFQDYQHPVYRQVYPGFEPRMGVIDLLFNEPRPQAIY